eukprot:3279435-Rhodomonas_salina.3
MVKESPRMFLTDREQTVDSGALQANLSVGVQTTSPNHDHLPFLTACDKYRQTFRKDGGLCEPGILVEGSRGEKLGRVQADPPVCGVMVLPTVESF